MVAHEQRQVWNEGMNVSGFPPNKLREKTGRLWTIDGVIEIVKTGEQTKGVGISDRLHEMG